MEYAKVSWILLLCLPALAFLALVFLAQIPGRNIIQDYSQTLKEFLYLQTETSQEKNLLLVSQGNCQSQSCRCQMEKMSTLAMYDTAPSIFEREQD